MDFGFDGLPSGGGPQASASREGAWSGLGLSECLEKNRKKRSVKVL